VGILGLCAGDTGRTWGAREIDALTNFAKLASIGLDNARLVDAAQRGALYDTTTGLPNRELLTDRIRHALAGGRGDASEVAVIMLDLDGFKVINESLGHGVGDRLLAAVGQRLANGVRPGDTVARFGGDEFGVILDPVADVVEARIIADRLGAELRLPFSLNGRDWFISASLGVAVTKPGRGTPDELLQQAEIAMVRAKSDPNHRLAVFESSMHDQTRERVDLEADLRFAVERRQLRLHYQPIVALGTREIARWTRPDAKRAHRTPLFVSVNLSARQFIQADLVDDVAKILADTGVPPGALELEITESVVMDQSEQGVRALRQLRALGIRLVLDDFGTGYSSLAYLKHLPLDTIKIDRSFVAGIDGIADRSIVDAVIALAHGLGFGVVAEGIETERQAERLGELGCDLGQGYLFARPMPAVDVRRLLRGEGDAPASLAG
jgi:diguanylate cyclase (GGDEF)-like protein